MIGYLRKSTILKKLSLWLNYNPKRKTTLAVQTPSYHGFFHCGAWISGMGIYEELSSGEGGGLWCEGQAVIQCIACLRSDMYAFFSQNCSWALIASVVSDIHFKCGTAQEITNRYFLRPRAFYRPRANDKNKIDWASKYGNQVIRLDCGCKRVKARHEGIQPEVVLKSILEMDEGK